MYKQLTADERCEIYELRQQGVALAAIGEKLGRNLATIGREIARNGEQHAYCPRQVQELRDGRARDRQNQRTVDRHVWKLAQQRWRGYWSPEHNASRFTADGNGHIGRKTIFSLIYADKRAAGDLHLHLSCQKERSKPYASGRS